MVDKEGAARSTLNAKRAAKTKQLAIEPAYVNNVSNPTVVLETLDNSILLRKSSEAAVKDVVAVEPVIDLEPATEAAEAADLEAEERLLMETDLFGSP